MECHYCQAQKTSLQKLKSHERLCKANPNRFVLVGAAKSNAVSKGNRQRQGITLSESAKAKISVSLTGKILSEEHKKAVSSGMVKAHQEGRAWNIGQSRWNNSPSYPERFMMEVIENEFLDKFYVQEMPFGIYSLDFAWPHLKKCIEVDGEQHERFPEYKERDIRKDQLLRESGWEVLRMPWKRLSADTKREIQVMRQFISDPAEPSW